MKRLIFTLSVFSLAGTVFGQNLAVTSLQAPVSGCELSANESIFVTVWNAGPGPHGGTYTVNYSLNSGPVVTASNSTTLLNNAVYNFTFPVPEDFSDCQVHDLKVWVDSGLDPVPGNDTLWATVTSDCPSIPGNIWGNSVICEGINNDSVFVSGQNGAIIAWESSPDGVSWTNHPTTNDFYNYVNLPGATIFRVIVDSPFGYCGPDTSNWFTLIANEQSDAGTLPADFDICDNGNSGFVYTTGYNGNIVDWNLSSNFGGSWIPLSQYNDTVWFNNLLNTTQYQVIVKNGVCPPDTSAYINLSLIPGTSPGTISGPGVVCNLENADSLVACCGNGTVVGWNVSTDSGATWQPTLETDSVFAFASLANETWFQAIWQFGTCPQETAQHNLIVLPVIQYETPDTTISEGDVINLEVVGGASWLWWPDQFIDDVTSNTPIVNPDSDITYWCEVTSIEGCKDTIRIIVTVNPDLTTLVIPNLFTPNADGHNDMWQIGNIESFTNNELIIFNAYGQVVYSAAPYNNEWAGTFNSSPLPDGTYFYQLELNEMGYEEPLKGVVTIAGSE